MWKRTRASLGRRESGPHGIKQRKSCQGAKEMVRKETAGCPASLTGKVSRQGLSHTEPVSAGSQAALSNWTRATGGGDQGNDGDFCCSYSPGV